MINHIQEIINLAVNAPSGDNSQPWSFEITDPTTLVVYNDDTADLSLYNYRQRGTVISHGALLENICILAQSFGYSTTYKLFPVKKTKDRILEVNFFPSSQTYAQPLAQVISLRKTNRKDYNKKPLQENHKLQLTKIEEEFGLHLSIVDDPANVQILANKLSYNERLLLENKTIHDELFSTIRWSKDEEMKYKTGLYIKTLELNAIQEAAFKLFRNWHVLRLFQFLGMPRAVAKDSEKRYATSSGFGLISIPTISEVNFFSTGRMLQKIWLTATKLGISLQPTAALLYLGYRIQDGDTTWFTKSQVNYILDFNSYIRTFLKTKDFYPSMLFRLGYAENPSASSIKKQPVMNV